MMEQTFCGKDCEVCTWRETQNCGGCRNGPGGRNEACKIAACCREKGHETCGTCGFALNCQILREREEIPQRRQEEEAARADRRQWLAEHAPTLGKWFWLIFWLNVPGVLVSLMHTSIVVERFPALELPGLVLSTFCSLIYAFFLWQMRGLEPDYRAAACCTFVVQPLVLAANLLDHFIGKNEGMAEFILAAMIPLLIGEFYASYKAYHGHGKVLAGLDDALSEKWPKLWKWEVGLLAGLLGCIVLLLISPILALLAVLAIVVGLVVVGIVKLVYQYRTAQLFRHYTVPENTLLPEQATE